MKKVICLVFIVIIIIAMFCGCGEKAKETKTTTVKPVSVSTTKENKEDTDTNKTEIKNTEKGVIPSVTNDSVSKNRTKEENIVKGIDLKLFGSYDKTLPYEENHTEGIIYYDDGVYIALEEINTEVIKNDNIEKTEVWNYDGTEKLDNLFVMFSAEIKEIEFINVPLGLKSVKRVFAIKMLPTEDYENFDNPTEYNRELSVAVYYIDENGTEQIVWVQLEKVVAYT